MRGVSSFAGWAVLGVVAALAGFFAQRMGLPAGWLVGPMLVALAFALAWKEHPTVPRWGRIASLAVVGGMLAATFRPSVFPLLARHWLPVGLVVCSTLFLSLGAGLLLSGLTNLDRKTTALGTLPGAASGMLAMSGPLGADVRLVALMQYTRVVVVVVSATLVGRPLPGAAAAPGAARTPPRAGPPHTAAKPAPLSRGYTSAPQDQRERARRRADSGLSLKPCPERTRSRTSPACSSRSSPSSPRSSCSGTRTSTGATSRCSRSCTCAGSLGRRPLACARDPRRAPRA